MSKYTPPSTITSKISEELTKLEFDEKNRATLMLRKKKCIKTDEFDFAMVLYTPYDNGRGVTETNVHTRDRTKQNVVFEHGYLMAKIGRENVCALVKGEIETPSDISGVVYIDIDIDIDLDLAGGWKNTVLNELRACGYEVKAI